MLEGELELERRQLRRGWRWHRAIYDVQRAGETIGKRRTFARALELALAGGADRIEKHEPGSGWRVRRRWVGAELELALERFARR